MRGARFLEVVVAGWAFALSAPAVANPTQDAAELRAVHTLDELARDDEAASSSAVAQAAERSIFEGPLRWVAEQHPSLGTRAKAAAALARMAWPPDAAQLEERIAVLAALTRHADAGLRAAAIAGLGEYAMPSARQALVRLQPADAAEAALVGAALERMTSGAAIRRLQEWFRGVPEAPTPESWALARAAAVVLSGPARTAAGPALQVILASSERERLRNVVRLSARVGEPSAKAAALAHLEATAQPGDVPTLLKLLGALSTTSRIAGARLLAGHATPEVADRLAAEIAQEESDAVTSFIVTALAAQAPQDLARVLPALLRGPPSTARGLLAQALRGRVDRRLVWPKVLALAAEPSAGTQAALLAEAIEDRRAVIVPLLSDATLGEPERRAAVRGLEGAVTPEVAPALLALLDPAAEDGLVRDVAWLVAPVDDDALATRLGELRAALPSERRGLVDELLLARRSAARDAVLARVVANEADEVAVASLLRRLTLRGSPALSAAASERLRVTDGPAVIEAALAALQEVDDPALAPRLASLLRRDGLPSAGLSEHERRKLLRVTYDRLSSLPDPAARDQIRALIAEGALPSELVGAAIADLGARGEPADAALLEPLSASAEPATRGAARRAMHRLAPDLHPPFDEGGRAPLVLASAGFGAALLSLTTEIADESQKKLLLGGGGAILGGSTAYLLTLDRDVTTGEAGYFATLGFWGTFAGAGLGDLLELRGAGPLWSAVAGEVLGVGAAWLTLGSARFALGDVVLTNVAATSLGVAGLGAAYLKGTTGSQAGPEDVFALGAAAAVVPMALLSPRLRIDSDTVGAVIFSVGWASWLGAFAPMALRDGAEASHALAGAGVGQALGLGAGLALGHLTRFDDRMAAWLSLGAASGAAAGGGLGLVSDRIDERWTYGLVELGTLAAGTTFALVGPKLRFHGTDLALIGLTTAAGAVSGARWVVRAAELAQLEGIDQEASNAELWGGGLLGGALGLYAGTVTSQYVDLTPGELVLSGFAAGVTGAGAASIALMRPSLDEDDFATLFSTGAAVGGLSMAFLAPKLRFTSADAGLALSASVLGGALGASIPAYWTDEERALADDERAGGAIFGASLGVLYAGAMSQLSEVEMGHVLRVDVATLAGIATGAGLGLVRDDDRRRDTVALAHAGALGAFTLASFSERRKDYEGRDVVRLGLGAAAGAWGTSYLPFVTLGEARAPHAEERRGGALLGLGLGTFASRLALAVDEKDAEDVAEVAVTTSLGALTGAGAWSLVSGSARERALALQIPTVLGWLTGELVASRTAYSTDDIFFASLMSAYGFAAGLALPLAIEHHDPESAALRGGALGAGLLGAAALAATAVSPRTVDDAAEIGVLAALGASAGLGLGAVSPESGAGERARAAEIGLMAALVSAWAVSPMTSFSETDLDWTMALTGLGAWTGAWAPSLRYGAAIDGGQTFAGAGAGASLGALGALAASQAFETHPERPLEASLYAGTSAAITGGLTLMEVLGDAERAAAINQGAAAGAFALGALIAPHTPPVDPVMQAGFMTLGAWEGFMLSAALERDEARERGGAALTGAGVGLLAGRALDAVYRLEPGDVNEMLGGAALAALGAQGLATTQGASSSSGATAVATASLVGAGLAAVAAPSTRYDDDDLPLLLAGGAWGAWLGGFAGDELSPQATRDSDRIGGGVLAGTALGLAAAAVGAQLVERDAGDLVEASVWMGAGHLMGSGLAGLAGLEGDARFAAFGGAGAVALAAGLHLGTSSQFDSEDVGLIALTTTIGGWHGAATARSAGLADDSSDEAVGHGVTLGVGAGVIGGLLLSQQLSLDLGDIAEAGVLWAAGEGAAYGVVDLLDVEDTQGGAALRQVSGLGFAALGVWGAQRTELDGPDRLLLAYGLAYGAGLGRIGVGVAADSEDEEGVGVLTGLTGLGLASVWLGQVTDYDTQDVGEVMAGSLLASGLGAGVGLLVSDEEAPVSGLTLGAGLAGTALFAHLAERTDLSAGDAGLGALAGLYGVYQGAGLALLGDASDRQVTGAMLAAGSAGALAGSVLGRYVDLDATDVLMLSAGSAWGLWIGGWTAAVLEENERGREGDEARSLFELGVGTTAVTTDLALVATSIAISRLVRMPPERFAWISVGGGGGLVIGTAVAGLTDGFSLRRGVLIGSIAGLAAGTIATGFAEFEPRAPTASRHEPLEPRGLASLLPQIDQWFPSVGAAPQPAGQGAPSKGSSFLVTISGTYR